MKIYCKSIKSGILTVMLICFLIGSIIAQAFIHPGINQNSNDLARIKHGKGEQEKISGEKYIVME